MYDLSHFFIYKNPNHKKIDVFAPENVDIVLNVLLLCTICIFVQQFDSLQTFVYFQLLNTSAQLQNWKASKSGVFVLIING